MTAGGPSVAPDELRVPTAAEMQRAHALAAHLCDYSLATGARRSVRLSTDLYGPTTPTVFIDQITGYHLVPVHSHRQGGGSAYRFVGWRADRVVHYPGGIEDDPRYQDAPEAVCEPLQRCESIESAIALVIMDVHRCWLTDEIDAYQTNEYLHRTAGSPHSAEALAV